MFIRIELTAFSQDHVDLGKMKLVRFGQQSFTFDGKDYLTTLNNPVIANQLALREFTEKMGSLFAIHGSGLQYTSTISMHY